MGVVMFSIQDVVSAYAAGYAGRDPAQLGRVQWWADTIGQDIPIAQISPEMIDDALAKLMAGQKGLGRGGRCRLHRGESTGPKTPEGLPDPWRRGELRGKRSALSRSLTCVKCGPQHSL